MSNLTVNQTIEEQLADFDNEVVSKNQYLYLYIRQAVRSTYWHLMARNVFFPITFDREINRPVNQQVAETLLRDMSVVIGCEYKIIDSFGYDPTKKITHQLPQTENLHHNIKLEVIQHEKEFYAVIRNTNSGLICSIGLARDTFEEAENDIRLNKFFYNKPQKNLV